MRGIRILIATTLLLSAIAGEASASESERGNTSLGIRVSVLPMEKLKLSGSQEDDTRSFGFGFGEGLVLDRSIGKYFRIGGEFMYYSRKLDGSEARDSVTTLSLRLAGTIPVADRMKIFVFASPGYSAYIGATDEADTISALSLQSGLGAEFTAGSLSFSLEFGYAYHFLVWDADTDDYADAIHGIQVAIVAKHLF